MAGAFYYQQELPSRVRVPVGARAGRKLYAACGARVLIPFTSSCTHTRPVKLAVGAGLPFVKMGPGPLLAGVGWLLVGAARRVRSASPRAERNKGLRINEGAES